MGNHNGIAGRVAPEFRVEKWLSNVESELQISQIAEAVIFLYNFQAQCPGCLSHGFPTMGHIRSLLVANGRIDQVKFIAIQTAFEDFDNNTEAAAIKAMERFGFSDIALGHDSGNPPSIMEDFRTGGTPWTVIIGPRPNRKVLFNGFQLDAASALELIDHTLSGL